MYAVRWGRSDNEEQNQSTLKPEDKERKTLLIKYLLDCGAQIDIMSTEGWSPLFLAIRYGPIDAVEIFSTSVDVEKSRPIDGKRAIHIAAEFAPVTGIKMLLAKKPNINATTSEADSPLLLAAKRDVNIVTLLLDAGANINHKNNKGENALKIAKKSKNKPIITLLKSKGATK